MQIKQIKIYIFDSLQDIYSGDELQSFTRLISENIISKPYSEILVNNNDVLTEHQEKLFFTIIDKLKTEMPIQYIFGNTEFYNINLIVEKGVLIPRNETEELVDWIIDDNKNKENLNVLDIGTGSGCIILSLAKALNTNNAEAIDISDDALKIAQRNAELNNLDISFSKEDVLKINADVFNKKYDIIISNPPYVRESEKQLMQNNVLNYEPEIALFVDDDNALVFYDKISKLASSLLKPNGSLYFEINESLGEKTVELIKNNGFSNVILKNDINDKPRMIKANL